ncbi:MBL fold metallo-hydrolase [Microcella daejeonensis]|uniref:MBL fold metallo-hydrolase n=1 Tax=Microcella daejeonensis TaxID=2994971 RepID=A0A9E8MN31_9MICO|nr:MBL fold metallo-hydrolase [Microcella daejeonensis]WAB81751.1 MBL fold metallo-hydrolase [Microcella daejeonensis]
MIVTKREHACLVLQNEGSTLVIDPGVFTAPFEVENLVAIVITHEHPDHVTAEHLDRLLAAAPGTLLYAPAGVAAAMPGYLWHTVSAGELRTVPGFSLRFTGGEHATIHSSIAPIDNVGVMVNDQLYYPGDSFADPDAPVHTLAVPASAPWLKVGEVMDFVGAVKPHQAFPTHELVNSEAGQAMTNGRIESVQAQHGGSFVALAPGESLDLG